MRKSSQVTLVFLAAVFAIILFSGCEEEATNDKMARLIANENRQLKSQLEQRDKEMQRQKQHLEKEIKKQTQLLEKCSQAKKALEQRTSEEMSRQVESVFGSVMDQTRSCVRK